MSKRTGSEVQANRETKKQKSDDSKLKTLLPELFENDPATNALEPAATDEEIKKVFIISLCFLLFLIAYLIVRRGIRIDYASLLQTALKIRQWRTIKK